MRMRAAIPVCAVLAGMLVNAAAGADSLTGLEINELDVPGNVVAVEPRSDWAFVNTDLGYFHVVKVVDGTVGLGWGVDGGPLGEEPPDLLPQSRSVPGEWDLGRVWLSDATDRYRHGVLGDRLEASSLSVRRRDRVITRLDAGSGAVFEDLLPRLVDLDGDGRAEIIVVKSYLDRGAALAIAGLNADGELAILAETPPIGRPNRSLNPVGAADFDGDGAVEIAYVETPHIGGRLMIWEWRVGALVKEHDEPGFSNHAIGSTELGLSAVADFDGDGLVDLVVPGRNRDRLRMISLARGRFRELADVDLGGIPATAIAPVGGSLIFGLEDGKLFALRFAP